MTHVSLRQQLVRRYINTMLQQQNKTKNKNKLASVQYIDSKLRFPLDGERKNLIRCHTLLVVATGSGRLRSSTLRSRYCQGGTSRARATVLCCNSCTFPLKSRSRQHRWQHQDLSATEQNPPESAARHQKHTLSILSLSAFYAL